MFLAIGLVGAGLAALRRDQRARPSELIPRPFPSPRRLRGSFALWATPSHPVHPTRRGPYAARQDLPERHRDGRNTPLIQLNRLAAGSAARIAVKHEGYNPFSSVKDRIGMAMCRTRSTAARSSREWSSSSRPREHRDRAAPPTGHRAGYRPFSPCGNHDPRASPLLRALGSRWCSPKVPKGMKGPCPAKRFSSAWGERGWMPRQFDNPANPAIHYQTTARRSGRHCREGRFPGVGIAPADHHGRGQVPARERSRASSSWRSSPRKPGAVGGQPAPTSIARIGPGFVPSILDTKLYNESCG